MRNWFASKLGSYSHDYVPRANTFMEVDVEKVAKELKVSEDGKARGASNQPSPDVSGFDQVENRITNRILARLNEAKSDYDRSISAYNDRIGTLDLSARAAQIRTGAVGASTDLDTALHNGADTLYRLRLDVLDAQDDYEHFRKLHGIVRTAHYPDSKWMLKSIIALLLVIEAFLNGTVFGQGHEFGLIGGISIALLVAVVNVVVLGILGSIVARFIAQPSVLWKVLGIIMMPVFVAFVLFLSLLGAHMRSAMKAGLPDYEAVAWGQLLSDPFAIGDVVSLLFIVMTMAFAAFAAFDFFRLDDPIFGYGRRDRKLKLAEESYSEMKAALVDEMIKIRDDRVIDMKAAVEKLRSHLSLHQSLLGERASLHSRFLSYLGYLESVGNTLLSRYRDANLVTRKEPAPPHFREPWKMPRPDLVEVRTSESDLRSLADKVEETAGVLERSIGKVENSLSHHVHKYNKIQELSREEVRRGPADAPTS